MARTRQDIDSSSRVQEAMKIPHVCKKRRLDFDTVEKLPKKEKIVPERETFCEQILLRMVDASILPHLSDVVNGGAFVSMYRLIFTICVESHPPIEVDEQALKTRIERLTGKQLELCLVVLRYLTENDEDVVLETLQLSYKVFLSMMVRHIQEKDMRPVDVRRMASVFFL
jgi:hypothetical protein